MFGFGFSRMRDAAMQGDAEKVNRLVMQGAKPNVAGSNGHTALHIAAINNHAEVIHLLAKAGADVNLKDRTGVTPLELALRGSQPLALEALLEEGAELHAINGKPALDYAQGEFSRHEAVLDRMNRYKYDDEVLIRMSGVITVLREHGA